MLMQPKATVSILLLNFLGFFCIEYDSKCINLYISFLQYCLSVSFQLPPSDFITYPTLAQFIDKYIHAQRLSAAACCFQLKLLVSLISLNSVTCLSWFLVYNQNDRLFFFLYNRPSRKDESLALKLHILNSDKRVILIFVTSLMCCFKVVKYCFNYEWHVGFVCVCWWLFAHVYVATAMTQCIKLPTAWTP